MAIEVVAEGKLEEASDFQGFIRMIAQLAQEWHLKMEEFEEYAQIEVCPEGFIEINYLKPYLSIATQTNVAGPGYHAFACDFFAKIAEMSPIPLSVTDPSNYYNSRDFEQLRSGVFERWLRDLGNYIETNSAQMESLCIAWPLTYYKPMEQPGQLVTPLGYISIEEFTYSTPHELAQRFFIWNERERDALFYRNSALSLLWKECWFAYSNMNEYTMKQADTIIDLVELAYAKDASLPLPLHEYHQLCNVRGREALIHTGEMMRDVTTIGYRKGMVEFPFGCWWIEASGFAQCSLEQDGDVLYIIGPYYDEASPWEWMYRMHTVAYDEEKEQQFLTNDAMQEEPFAFMDEQIQGSVMLKAQEDHTHITAYLRVQEHCLWLDAYVLPSANVEQVLEQIRHIRCQMDEPTPTQA